ncbi:Oxysterol-binding protein-like protein [Glarea lozoyensis ATCC 20868]|uniref:Oxysterol-binding protein-like protein n=1 Tax=Glarea lozoyensis (strain ATCC 20868 / MF5171) TaxID=1116229 RepID=S3CNG2_GLAL2|nr:Oxysterol-binding protein-like protein [Glarea lozoyensis ATCC 20868]EPE28032.1 Oxysterol-binding protein-like protein [Glarea lozoyensis ATCC 20868]
MVSLVHGHRRASGASNRSSVDESRSDGAEDDSTVVEPDQGNVETRGGSEPGCVTNVYSGAEDFMAHPETLLAMPQIEDPVESGVKKPLNPILGETYTCYWDLPNNTKGYYISEQTSHHPPKSSYFYMAPEHHIRIDGCLKPRSKFLGNSAASLMEGLAILRFLNRGNNPKGESYFISQPNMYARGILFGKMKYELGDHSFVKCPELGLSADVEFKTKGYFGGTYNAIGGTIKNDHTGEVLYELSGMWNGEMFIKDLKTGKKDLMFNAAKSKHTPPTTRPLEEQDERESQKLWYKTVQAIIARNHEVATDEKTTIENMQRDEAARRAEEGIDWQAKLFRPVRGGPGGSEEGEEDLDWILNANIDGDTPEKQVEQILAITPILPGQKPNQKNQIPPSHQQAAEKSAAEKSTTENSTATAATATPSPPPSTQNLPPAPLASAGNTKATPSPISTPKAAPISSPKVAPISHENDLVDFGQNDSAPPQKSAIQSQMPADLYAAQTQNGGQKQKELEQTLLSTSTSRENQGGPLLDFHDDLKRDLPAGGTETEKARHAALLRKDTDTDSLDEFVDAES